ncbi:tripartite tricarboxylate transporter TctB family protein [Lentilitoribacter sp. EG35]|uniref:tripartite tricarboxylate transporter TctB family protein n=1 Tax=Lentilitoribacter sp. EG35 TaxID=3234192 RepID=UPI003460DAC2
MEKKMLKNIDRTKNIISSTVLLLLGIYIVTIVFPDQIPDGLEGDSASDDYPRGIMYVWILSSIAWLIIAFTGEMDSPDSDTEIAAWFNKKGLVAIGIIGLGYLIFATVGFLAASFFLIVSLSYVCGERGCVPWILGAICPLCIYFFLDFVLDVTLPTFFQF